MATPDLAGKGQACSLDWSLPINAIPTLLGPSQKNPGKGLGMLGSHKLARGSTMQTPGAQVP